MAKTNIWYKYIKRMVKDVFCSSCGSQLAERALFCQRCGAKVNHVDNAVQIKQNDIGRELDREALKIYLGDVLALECIVNQYSTVISEQDNAISRMIRNNYFQAYSLSLNDNYNNYHAYFLYDSNEYYVLTTERGNQIESSHCYTDTVWTPAQHVLTIIDESNTWDRFVPCTIGFFEAKKRRKMFKEQFLNAYADFRQKAPSGYQKNLTSISITKDKNQILSKKRNEAKALLKKLYQVNIIPESFRNDLYAIFYLHNFVTTSNLSFETALLHYNLEEIKSKLDTIIEQQKEIIVNQAIAIAQNKTICEQNQKQLKKLSNIETNSYCAAQYAEIGARNAEAAAWIGLANYIK